MSVSLALWGICSTDCYVSNSRTLRNLFRWITKSVSRTLRNMFQLIVTSVTRGLQGIYANGLLRQYLSYSKESLLIDFYVRISCALRNLSSLLVPIVYVTSKPKWLITPIESASITRSGVAEWLQWWSCNLVVSGSSPPPCHSLDFSPVAPSSISRLRWVNSQLVSLLSVEIFKHSMFNSVNVKRYSIAIEIELYK